MEDFNLHQAALSNEPYITQVVDSLVSNDEEAWAKFARKLAKVVTNGVQLESFNQLKPGMIGCVAGTYYAHTREGVEIFDPIMNNTHAQIASQILRINVGSAEDIDGDEICYGVILENESDPNGKINYTALCPVQNGEYDEAFTIITLAIGLQIYDEA